MSSIAGWLEAEPTPLRPLLEALRELRGELPREYHESQFGSVAGLAFLAASGAEASSQAARIHARAGPGDRVRVAPRMIGSHAFVEVQVQAGDSAELGALLARIGVGDIRSRMVLAEQTAADGPAMPSGLAIVDGLIFAANGGISDAVSTSSLAKEFAVAARTHGLHPGDDATIFAAWMAGQHQEGLSWNEVLAREPTYLFSALVDANSPQLALTALKRRTNEKGEASAYDHLFYRSHRSGVRIARTSRALDVMSTSIRGADTKVPDGGVVTWPDPAKVNGPHL